MSRASWREIRSMPRVRRSSRSEGSALTRRARVGSPAAFPAARPVEAQDAVGLAEACRVPRGKLGRGPRGSTVGSPIRSADAARRVEVLLEAKRPSAVDPERLEGRLASQQRQVVGVQDRLVRVDDPAAGDRQREQRHAGSGSGAASARSRRGAAVPSPTTPRSPPPGSESHTMPPPTQRWMRPSATAKVRIVRASSRSPFG